MRGGFSFCGVDIADIGLEYAPENKDTYVYAPGEITIHDETFEGHNGGYSYGVSRGPKEFTLRCYYEDHHIDRGFMAKALNLFRPGKKGMLIFKRRPWCYYYCTVISSPDISEMYNYMNGLFTITMKAYYPFARGCNVKPIADEEEALKHLFYNDVKDEFHANVMENSGMLDKEYMVPSMTFSSPDNTTILLFNPGTERANVGIVISGKAGDNGVIIANKTTGQNCRYVGFDSSIDGTIITDGISGKTIKDAGYDGTKLAFLFHDYGLLELEPAFPILRDIYVKQYKNGSKNVETYNRLFDTQDEQDWYKGKYIFLEHKEGTEVKGKWYKINKCIDKHNLELTANYVTPSGGTITEKCKTCIVLMNEIEIQGSNNTNIERLSFTYKPTYA